MKGTLRKKYKKMQKIMNIIIAKPLIHQLSSLRLQEAKHIELIQGSYKFQNLRIYQMFQSKFFLIKIFIKINQHNINY